MKTINKLFDYFEEFMLFIIMAAMIVMNFLNVLFRFLLPQSPFSYTEELTLLLFVWATMIGIACGLKRGSHTGMSVSYTHLTYPWQSDKAETVGPVRCRCALRRDFRAFPDRYCSLQNGRPGSLSLQTLERGCRGLS